MAARPPQPRVSHTRRSSARGSGPVPYGAQRGRASAAAGRPGVRRGGAAGRDGYLPGGSGDNGKTIAIVVGSVASVLLIVILAVAVGSGGGSTPARRGDGASDDNPTTVRNYTQPASTNAADGADRADGDAGDEDLDDFTRQLEETDPNWDPDNPLSGRANRRDETQANRRNNRD